MFAEAIEKATEYCRPIKTISRIYKSDEVIPQASTMFFVNGEGAAVTCKHVAEEIMRAGKMNAKYESFKKERKSIPDEVNIRIETNRIERRYEYVKGETKIQFRYNFSKCFGKVSRLGIELHPTYDLAIIRFGGFETPLFRGHSVFPMGAVKIRIGMSVCRLGYPVTDFDDYGYVRETDDIQWTSGGNHFAREYPSEGIVTSVTKGEDGKISTFCVSGMFAKGFCGAPVIDANGSLVGIVTGSTTEIIDGNKVTFTECVNADVIRCFLREKEIRYFEE